jgi:hypothetical protein
VLYVPKKKDTASSVEVTTDPSSLLIRCLQSKKKASLSVTQHGGHSRSSQEEKKRKSAGGAGASQAEAVNPQKKPARDVQRTIYSREKLLQMTVQELKDLCRDDHLAVSGKKNDLVERILKSQ